MSMKTGPPPHNVTEQEVKEKYEAEFEPYYYLNLLFRKPVNEDDHSSDYMKFVVANLHRIFTIDLPPVGESLLVMGCGPTIHEAISASNIYKTIVMAEFLEQNREAVKKWIRKDPDAFDWTYVFQTVAKLEKESDHTKLEARLRSRKIEVVPFDLTLSEPLGALKRTFDVIVSGSCYEAIAIGDESYKKMVAKTADYLAPNGHLIVVGEFNCTYYAPTSKGTFYSFSNRKELVEEAMAEAGLEIDHWLILPFPEGAEIANSDTTEMFIVLAKKTSR